MFLQHSAKGRSLAALTRLRQEVLPNPSLERGPSNGLARVASQVYAPPRGPSRRWSAQLKR